MKCIKWLSCYDLFEILLVDDNTSFKDIYSPKLIWREIIHKLVQSSTECDLSLLPTIATLIKNVPYSTVKQIIWYQEIIPNIKKKPVLTIYFFTLDFKFTQGFKGLWFTLCFVSEKHNLSMQPCYSKSCYSINNRNGDLPEGVCMWLLQLPVISISAAFLPSTGHGSCELWLRQGCLYGMWMWESYF